MIELNPKLWRTEPTSEQIDGVKHLINNPNAALFDRPGFGKTKQVIDSHCVLKEVHIIDTVVVTCPASVRGVWDQPDFGELAKHSWLPYMTSRCDSLDWEVPNHSKDTLLWILISYGYIRKKQNDDYPVVKQLVQKLKGRNISLVLDESSYIKSKDSHQFKSSLKLKKKIAQRTYILNGTPMSNTVMDLWPQFMVLDPKILDVFDNGEPLTATQFRARYCILNMRSIPNRRPFIQIVGNNEEAIKELRERAKPWILRRLTTGLPPKTYSIREAILSAKEWKLYQEMRDYLVAWLGENPSQASNGAVKMIRLAQITSGFIGGISDLQLDLLQENTKEVQEIGDSKQQIFFEWLDTIESDEQVIIWCRFRKELERLANKLQSMGRNIGLVYGGQLDSKRQTFINGFQQGAIQFLLANTQAGGSGLNLANARYSFYLSNDFSLTNRDQSEQRIHRRGQTRETHIIDCLATGPSGEKTIDHHILKALRDKEQFANWTAEAWIKKLKET